jgi:hypothetical protein
VGLGPIRHLRIWHTALDEWRALVYNETVNQGAT